MVDSATVDDICARHGDAPDALIEVLHDVQEALGFLPEEALARIAHRLNLSRAEVHGVASFYHDFRLRPGGRVTLRLCRAEACQAMGAEALIEAVSRRLGAAPGTVSAAGVAVEHVYCLGNCALAPAAMVGDRLIGRATPEAIAARLADAGV
ncbi:MAG: formate dehydrogenase subunit gamma [Paracoccaceae bacterium]|nr:MAG: NADH-quinone oxidoreductase subunit E [Alphaproteobacteria bacterium]GIX12242.1 MAG: formate dehydrogenase subunit gamma [Paracoccaceae bacterium]